MGLSPQACHADAGLSPDNPTIAVRNPIHSFPNFYSQTRSIAVELGAVLDAWEAMRQVELEQRRLQTMVEEFTQALQTSQQESQRFFREDSALSRKLERLTREQAGEHKLFTKQLEEQLARDLAREYKKQKMSQEDPLTEEQRVKQVAQWMLKEANLRAASDERIEEQKQNAEAQRNEWVVRLEHLRAGELLEQAKQRSLKDSLQSIAYFLQTIRTQQPRFTLAYSQSLRRFQQTCRGFLDQEDVDSDARTAWLEQALHPIPQGLRENMEGLYQIGRAHV